MSREDRLAMRGRKQEWKIKDGKLVVETPAVAAVAQEMPVERLNQRIKQVQKRKEQAETRLARIQAEVDRWAEEETQLLALKDELES